MERTTFCTGAMCACWNAPRRSRDYRGRGVTADGFDKVRGKINVSQTLNERMRSVQELGIADEVIVEEYEGQKIDTSDVWELMCSP